MKALDHPACIGVLSAVALVWGAELRAEDAIACDNSMIVVVEADAPLAAQICDVADKGLALLESCDLRLKYPVHVLPVERIVHSDTICLGRYQIGGGVLQITEPGAIKDLVEPDHPFAKIPVDELFAGVIVHELAHAALDQMALDGQQCIANHEYTAYAMQMSTFSEATRQALIEASGGPREVEQELLNDFVASVVPTKFAAFVWQHFSQPENGCDFVKALVRGDMTLRMQEM